jgi:hypothetical protein
LVVLVEQMLHETGFVFGTYQAFIDTNFLMRGVVMPEYPVCMVHQGLVPCTGIAVWFSRAWQSIILDKGEEAQQVGKAMRGNHFPKPWGGLGTEWASMMLWLAFSCPYLESFHLVHGNSGSVFLAEWEHYLPYC